MANVMLSLLHHLGCDEIETFGDSTGELDLAGSSLATPVATS
jgi:hypothetical protein